jgi:hypothetical protein
VNRREVLSGLSAAVGALGLSGCNGLSGDAVPGGPQAGAGARTLTPAPVPTARPTTRRPASREAGCPELPLEADIVRCASETPARESIRLVPESSTYDSGSGPFAFTLRNTTTLTFRTGRDQWVLAQRAGDEWTVVARGGGSDLLWVEPGGSFSWVLGANPAVATGGSRGTEDAEPEPFDESPGTGDAGSEPLEVAVGGGPHALAVIGAVPRGARTALVARFRIEPSLG